MEPYWRGAPELVARSGSGSVGRASIRSEDGTVTEQLFRDDCPLVRIPQLAIHLDRDINEKGLILDRQLHLNGVWGLGHGVEVEFRAWLADLIGVAAEDVLAWDAMAHDTIAGRPAGRR